LLGDVVYAPQYSKNVIFSKQHEGIPNTLDDERPFQLTSAAGAELQMDRAVSKYRHIAAARKAYASSPTNCILYYTPRQL
jgi:hypothetical protein